MPLHVGFCEYLISPLVSFYLPNHQKKIKKSFPVGDGIVAFYTPHLKQGNNKPRITKGLENPCRKSYSFISAASYLTEIEHVIFSSVSKCLYCTLGFSPNYQIIVLMRCKYVSFMLPLKHLNFIYVLW